MYEWALLIFTVCMQAAIGGMLMLALSYKSLSKLGQEQSFRLLKMPLLIIGGLSIVGLAASFAHLGTPTNAFNTIRNIGSSWMSREILFTGMFIGGAVVTVGLALVQKKANHLLLIICTVIGLIDIYCMGAIYANSLVSGWHSLNTFTSFYGTALILGPVVAASCIVPLLREMQGDLAQNIVKNAFYISLFGIAIQVIGVALFGSSIPEVNMIAGNNGIASLENYQSTVVIRWIIEAIGMSVLGYLSVSKSKKVSASFVFIALAVLVFAEGMSRYVFYILGA